MNRAAEAAGVALFLSASGLVQAQELNGASLAGLARLGAVIVTASSDTVSESEVRQVVEARLAQAKIAVEGGPGPELLVSVSAQRDRAETGNCQFGTFRVDVSLREAVSLERAPDQGQVAAITWRTGGSIRRFSTKSPRLAIIDTVQDALSVFERAIASDGQQAGRNRAEP
jgi:hypothetical protein